MFDVIISLLPHSIIVFISIGKALADVNNKSHAWIESFNFTPVQIEKIKLIEDKYEDSIDKFVEEVREKEILLTRSIVGAGSIEELRKIERELELLKVAAAQICFEKFLDIREILTPEQILEKCEIYTLTVEELMDKFRQMKPQQN